MLNIDQLTADGVIDAGEASEMRTDLYADGVIDKDEMDTLFAINDKVTGNANCKEYEDLFVEAITDGVLADETSPNELDEEESQYLIGKIEGDEKVDDLEKRLIKNILNKATKVADSFTEFAKRAGVTV